MSWIDFSFCSGLEGIMKDDLQHSMKIFDGFFISKNPIWPPLNPKFEHFNHIQWAGNYSKFLGSAQYGNNK